MSNTACDLGRACPECRREDAKATTHDQRYGEEITSVGVLHVSPVLGEEGENSMLVWPAWENSP